MSDATATPHAMLAEFEDVDTVLAAARSIRDAGFKHWDVHSPFPIHGIDAAMGIQPTRLPWIVLGGGLTGMVGGLLLAWWTNAVDYPFLISGKPIFSLPANIPVIFETTVLLAAFGAVFGMLLLNALPMLYNPLFKSRRFRRVTDDRFVIVIEAGDRRFDPHRTRELFESLGATHVETVEED
jgi:hypothetical protein